MKVVAVLCLKIFTTTQLYCSQACIRCGATSTPLWRPEVLSGPKVLCNACGVRVLYPIKSRRPKSDAALAPPPHHSHLNGSAQHFPQQKNGFQSTKRPRTHAEDNTRQQTPFAHISKRQRIASVGSGDVKLSPTQKQYLEVQRHFDSSSRKVVEWTITDCTIDDARDFQQLTHAQAFIDECWAFISADLRYAAVSTILRLAFYMQHCAWHVQSCNYQEWIIIHAS